MNKQYEQVKEFHESFDQGMPEVPTFLDNGPLATNNWLIGSLHSLTQEIKAVSSQDYKGKNIGGMVAKRVSWMLEELTEFASADTLEEQVNALIDLIYFAIGTFTLMGVKPEPFFNIVHAANMGKLHEDGKPRFNEQGKIIKPDNWKEQFAPEPMILEELRKQSTGVEFGTYEAHQPNYEGFKQLGVLDDYVYQSLAHMGNASHHFSWGLTVLEHTDVPSELQEEIRQAGIKISDLQEKLRVYGK